MTTVADQLGMFENGRALLRDKNALFLEMVRDGLTREELEMLITNSPDTWILFIQWLDVLPSS